MAKHKTRNKASNCINLCGKALDWFPLLTSAVVVAGSLPSSIGNNNDQEIILINTKICDFACGCAVLWLIKSFVNLLAPIP